MLKTMVMKDALRLRSQVSDADYKILDKYLLEKMQVSIGVFDTYKPFVLSAMFMSFLLDCTPRSLEAELVKFSSLQNEPSLWTGND